MTANLDHIDLNSDVVSVDPENDFRVSTKTLNKVGDFDGSVDLEAEIGGGDRDSDSKVVGDGVRLTQAEDAVENEARSDNEAKDGTWSSVSVDAVTQEQNLDSSRGAMDMVVGGISDVLLGEGADHISAKQTADGVDNQAMEIDEHANCSEDQNEWAGVLDAGDFQESDEDGNKSEELNLVEGSSTYARRDGNATGDQNVKGSKVKPDFSIADLVWGKVRSYPWWPGQICDPSTSSKKAKKYCKKDCYLIAYFGDQTFAWNEASKIKHFGPHFSQMEKQNNLEDFHYAIECALDEVSRRVEFGLACPCVPEYSKLKTQIIVNAGIREECSRRDGGDSFSGTVSFEPAKLVEYVKALGQLPSGGMDRFKFATMQAQLLAINRLKGYSNLPEFQMLGDLLESGAEIPLPAERINRSERNESVATKAKDTNHPFTEKGKPKREDRVSPKRKNILEDNVHPNKKEESLAEVVAETRLSVSNGKSGMGTKATGKFSLPSLGKKRKAVDTNSSDLAVKSSKNLMLSGSDDKSSQPKKTYRVGDSILRVASQLNGPTPILKYVIGASQETAGKNKNK